MPPSDLPISPGGHTTPPAADPPPPAIPGHRLLRRIGHGSYGDIWLAQTELGAWRAVKIVRRANFTSDKPYDREFNGIQLFEPVSREHEGLVDTPSPTSPTPSRAKSRPAPACR